MSILFIHWSKLVNFYDMYLHTRGYLFCDRKEDEQFKYKKIWN
jgi:hypothetical protein